MLGMRLVKSGVGNKRSVGHTKAADQTNPRCFWVHISEPGIDLSRSRTARAKIMSS